MPDVAMVGDFEIRRWFGEQLTRTDPNGKKVTQVQLGERIGVSGSTISRNRDRLYRGEPLARDFRKVIHDKLAVQQLDVKGTWHLRQVQKTQAEAMARVEAERKAREDRIEAKRQVEASRVEAQRRAKAQRRADLRAEWDRLDAGRPPWAPAGRLPLLPTVVEVGWFGDALSLETRMMRDEDVPLDRSLLGWSEDVEEKQATLDLLTARARRRRQAISAGKVAFVAAQIVLWVSLAVALFLLAGQAIIWAPIVLSVLAPVLVGAAWYATVAVGQLIYNVATSLETLLVLGCLTAVLIKMTPDRVRGRSESRVDNWIERLAVLSAILLFVAAISWLAAEILPRIA